MLVNIVVIMNLLKIAAIILIHNCGWNYSSITLSFSLSLPNFAIRFIYKSNHLLKL